MNRAIQLWLFTTTLTLLAIALLVIIAMLSMAYLPGLFLYILVVAGAALSAGIAALVRRHTRV